MKICIERSDRMGDMILTLPVIQGIKQQNPKTIIHVIGSKKNLKICKQFSLIDKTYEKSTEPVIEYYKKLNLLKVIDGERSIDQINKEISDIIDLI